MSVRYWWQKLNRRIGDLWHKTKSRFAPRWYVEFVNSDILPSELGSRKLVITQDDDEYWSAGMSCPCRCGDVIELPLFPEADQRWRVTIDGQGRPSLSPSVWRKTGCKSHFWMREGRILWCR